MNLYKINNMKNTTIQILLAVIITFGTMIVVCGQGDPFQYNHLEKFYPQSPSTSSFEKFINIPQANYTGIHGFSVPIYNIAIKDETFPISIDYHGMGVNVNEIAGVVGLGWTLNLGGVNLSQEIRGYDDFTSLQIENLNKATDFWSNNLNPLLPNYNYDQYINAIKIAGGYEFLTSGYTGPGRPWELSPDYFSYSLLNNSGKFIKDKLHHLKGFHTIPKDDVSIHLNHTPNDFTFTLTDKNRIEYTFKRYKHSHNQSGVYDVDYYDTYSYRVDKIYFPENNKTMTFKYIETSYNYISNYQKSQVLYGGVVGDNNLPSSVRTTTNVLSEFLIEEIRYEETAVYFSYIGDYEGGRKDVKGGKKLTGITIKHEPANGTHKIIKNYSINTSYIQSDLGFPNISDANYPARTFINRLRLNSIVEILSGNTYSFDYDDNKPLPARFSPFTDWWGSFTKPGVSEHIPSYLYRKTRYDDPIKYFRGGNKEPDLDYAVSGSLKRIHFPTGGFQEFHYELDEYKFNDYEIEYKPSGMVLEELDLERLHEQNIIYIPVESPDYRKGFDYQLIFGTNHANCMGNTEGVPIGRYYIFELYKENGENDILISTTTPYIENAFTYQLNGFDDINANYYIKITAKGGGYSPTNCPRPVPDNVKILLNTHLLYVHKTDPIYKKNKNAGHLRVGAITLHDEGGDTLIKRKFEYKNFSDRTFSSGVFTGIPVNTFLVTVAPNLTQNMDNTCPSCPDYWTTAYTTVSSNPALSLNSSFGKSVFYENVTEIYQDLKAPSNSFRKEFVFKLPNQEDKPQYRNPVIYSPHTEYTGGQLLEERIYDSSFNPNISDNISSLVKKIKNQYSEPDSYFNSSSTFYDASIPDYISFGVAATLQENVRVDCNPPSCDYDYIHETNIYNIPSGWVKHLSITQEDYKNGTLWMTNTTNYNYSPTYSHLNPVSVTQTNSLGQELRTEYGYGHPYKSDEPTIIKQYENGSPTFIKQTTFQGSLPKHEFAKKASETLDNVLPSEDLMLTYDRYDADGNLQQYTMENGTPVSIIWGYNGQYPIAKVEGKAYSDIEDLADLLIIDSNSSYGLLPEYFNNLRNVAGALVTCYIYKPLVGVTTIIQPNGQKETYEYDTSGRLTQVKDHNGHVIKKMDYHYKNQ